MSVLLVRISPRIEKMDLRLTTLMTPMRMLGGVLSSLTMDEMKLAVMPMIAMSEHVWKMRAS